jgi:RimJ/RimL family protein N-acetyltransferase
MTLTRDSDQMESERLILRRIEPGDLGFLTRLYANAEVARYLGHGRPRSPVTPTTHAR